MQNLKYTCIIVVIICIFLYVYWLKLKRGKDGRIPGREVEKSRNICRKIFRRKRVKGE